MEKKEIQQTAKLDIKDNISSKDLDKQISQSKEIKQSEKKSIIPEKSKEIKQTAQIENLDDLIWYYIDRKDENKVKGAISRRDLEALWKTSSIDSKTYVWKKGMIDWKPVNEIEELQKAIMDNASELQKIQQEFMNIKNEIGKEKNKTNKNENSLDKAVENIMSILGGGELDLSDDENKNGKRPRKQSKEIDTSTMTAEQIKKIQKNKKKAQKQAEKRKQQWYQTKINTNIYIQGLPLDCTEEEVKEFASKAGIIRIDIKTGKEKIKLYKDSNGNLKGDACVSYQMEESVSLAIEMMNDREIREGYKVIIVKAEFQQKGDAYIKRDKIDVDKVALAKAKAQKEQAQTWDEIQKGEGLQIVILKGVFKLQDATYPSFFEEIKEDIQLECEQKLGPIQRFKIYEQNPEGVVEIKFKEAVAAEACIKLMNGRYFGGTQISCEYYDGVTNYKKIKESENDEQNRIDEFGAWLEGQSDDD